MTEQDEVLFEWARLNIALITLNRPDKLNALTRPVVARLIELLHQAAETSDCRAVVITGAGRAFCAGMDIDAGVSPSPVRPATEAELVEGQEAFSSMARTIHSLRVPVVAAVNGVAAGAGMAITLACDIRVGSPISDFHVASVKIGLSAGESGISYFLPRLIGAARAYEYLLTGMPIRSADALRLGLVSQLVDGDVANAALDLAEAIAVNSPIAVNETKAVLRANADLAFDESIELENQTQVRCMQSHDFREGMQAFVERRPPAFLGK